jgi:hypothetical protein
MQQWKIVLENHMDIQDVHFARRQRMIVIYLLLGVVMVYLEKGKNVIVVVSMDLASVPRRANNFSAVMELFLHI